MTHTNSTSRFDLPIWEGTDDFDRLEFNAAHQSIEDNAAMFIVDPAGTGGYVAASYPQTFLYNSTSQVLYFSNGVTWGLVSGGTVGTSQLGDGSVTAVKIAANAVTRPKMATGFTGVTVGTAAPTSPVKGEVWYNTASDTLNVYTTATTGWRAPWNLPWGVISYGTATSHVTTTGNPPQFLPGLTASLPATWPANRRMRASVSLSNVTGSVSYAQFSLGITQDGGVLAETGYSIPPYVLAAPDVECIFSPSSGAHTYAVTISAVSGGGTTTTGINTGLAGGRFTQLVIEDVGPAATPA